MANLKHDIFYSLRLSYGIYITSENIRTNDTPLDTNSLMYLSYK